MAAPITPEEKARWQAMFSPPVGAPPTALGGGGTPPDQMARFREFAMAPPPPKEPVPAPASHDQTPGFAVTSPLTMPSLAEQRPGRTAPATSSALASKPLPPSAFEAPPPSADAGAQLGGAYQPMQLQMPASKPTYVPGGWGPASRSGRINLTGDEKSNFANADENREQANELHTQVAAQTAQQVAAKLNGQQIGIEAADADMQRREYDRNQAGQAAVAKLDSLTSDLNEKANIDPQKFWDDKPGFAKVIAAIGVAAGGFVAGRTGGPNTALDTIERAIDRNVDAQKARFAAARGKLDEQRGVYATMRAQFGDERMADVAAKHAYLENAERQVHNLIADNASKDVQARGQEILAGIQERKGGQAIELAKLAQGNLTEKYRPGGFVGGASPVNGASQDPKLFIPTGPNGEGYFARTQESADKLRAKRAYALALDEAAKTALKAREKTGVIERIGGKLPTNTFETKDYAALKSAQENVVQAAKRMEEMGQLQGGEKADVMGLVGDMTSIGGNPETSLQSYAAQKRKELEADERSQGGQGAQQSIALDQQGRPVAVANGQMSFAAPRGEMPSSFRPAGGGSVPRGYETPQKAKPWNGEIVQPKGKSGKKTSGSGPLTADERARYEEIVRSYPKDDK